MFNLEYENWKSIVEAYFSLSSSTLENYLQWYPFTKKINKNNLIEEEYFNMIIDGGYFLLDTTLIEVQNNYMQRPNGQYRQSQLISPELFLVLQAVCHKISQSVEIDRNSNISVYYSGKIENFAPHYKDEYSDFSKEVMLEKDSHDYFVKLDIANYFKNIDIDDLFVKIESYSKAMNQIDLLMYKELIRYIGNGSYPVIENSMGTSFLATVVYLASIDNEIYDYITNCNYISNIKMIRFVDDLYVLFDSKAGNLTLNKFFEEFIQFINTLLNNNKLNLNFEKTIFDVSSKIPDTLYKSFYDEVVNGEYFDIYDIEKDKQEELLITFLQRIENEFSESNIIKNEKFMDILKKSLVISDTDLSPREILSQILYSNKVDFTQPPVKDMILNISTNHIINIAPKMFTSLLLKTKDGGKIKENLNQLFNKSRDGKWTMNDIDLAVNYLLNRNFKHTNLMETLEKELGENNVLYKYFQCYSIPEKWTRNNIDQINLFESLKITKLTSKIFFLYLCNKKRGDYFAAYSYFKSYFDRITAEFDFYVNRKGKKPNYRSFHDRKRLSEFYCSFLNSEQIIKDASRYRNYNPINHGSAELLTKENITKEILENSLSELNGLITSFLEQLDE